MPRHTRTYDLREVEQDLDEELDQVADEAAQLDPEEDGQEYTELVQRAQTIEQHLAGVRWALEPPADEPRAEPYEEVTLGSLTAGEYAQVSDYTASASESRVGGPASIEGASRVFFVAAGLVDAPFVDEGSGFEEQAMSIRQLAPQFKTWLEDEVDELTTPDVDLGNGFAARVEQKRSRQESE